jgi:hypothetical protein
LWNYRQNFSTSLFKHVKNTLYGKESVRFLLFTDALEENGKIVMVVKLKNIDFPCNFVLRAVLN